jgi:hypothetical protein
MISDDEVRQLHDKFTCGTPLSVEEEGQLTEWCASQAHLEQEDSEEILPKNILEMTKVQLDNKLTQCSILSKRLHDISAETIVPENNET